MADKLLYVETVAAEALDLSEDIVCLEQVKSLLNRVRGRGIDTLRIDEAYNMVHGFERELRYLLRHRYIETKPRQVSESLRKRLREEAQKELGTNGNL